MSNQRLHQHLARLAPLWRQVIGYSVALGSVGLATGLRLVLGDMLGDKAPFATFFAAVMLTVWFSGISPALLVIVLSLASAVFFFIPPEQSFGVTAPSSLVNILVFMVVSLIVALLAESLRQTRSQAEMVAEEARMKQIRLESEMGERKLLTRTLNVQRRRMDDLLASLPGVVWETWNEPNERSQRIDFVSDYMEELLGYEVQEWLDTPDFWLTIVHPDDKEKAAQVARELYEKGGGSNTFRWVAKDGSIIWVESRAVAIKDNEGKPIGMRGVNLDITELKRVEEIQRYRIKASQALYTSLDYKATLSIVAELAVPEVADWCAIDLLENGTIERVAVAHADPAKVTLAHEVFERYPPDLDLPYGLGKVLRTGQPEVIREISQEMIEELIEDAEQLEILRELGLHSSMIMPLVHHGKILGALTFVSAESGRIFSDVDITLAEEMARRAALAIENARLFQETQEQQKELEGALARMRDLYEISRRIGSVNTPQDVLNALISSRVVESPQRANVFLFNRPWRDRPPESGNLTAVYQEATDIPNLTGQYFRFEDYMITDLCSRDNPTIITNVETDTRISAEARDILRPMNIKSMVIFPLIAHDQWYGLLSLQWARARAFNDMVVHHLQSIVDQAAAAIFTERALNAEAAARLEAERANDLKMEFLAMISHELRTPLMSVQGFAATLLAEDVTWDEESRRDFLMTMNQEADKLNDLVGQLLDLSRLEAGMLKIAQKRTTVQGILEQARPQLEVLTNQHKFEFQAADDLPAVQADPARIAQVLTNLVGNAAKFAPEGSRITVVVEEQDRHLCFRVKDEGDGIAPEERETIFEAFRQSRHTADTRKGGAGLGLAIAKGLVEEHGGKIWVENGTQHGTAISFTLPLDEIEE